MYWMSLFVLLSDIPGTGPWAGLKALEHCHVETLHSSFSNNYISLTIYFIAFICTCIRCLSVYVLIHLHAEYDTMDLKVTERTGNAENDKGRKHTRDRSVSSDQ